MVCFLEEETGECLMPRTRFYNLPEEKRSQLLDAAAEVFSVHGFENASYNKIIEKAGVSKGAMYYYFNDKEDLYSAVIEDAFSRMMVLFDGFPEVESPEEFFEELEIIIVKIQEYMKENRRDVELMRGLLKAESGTFQLDKLCELRSRNRSITMDLLLAGRRVGVVREDIPPELLADVLDAQDQVLDKWMAETIDLSSKEGVRRWSEIAMDFVMRLILKPALLVQKYGKG